MVGLTVRFTSIGARVIVSFTLLNLAKIDLKEVAGGTMAYDLALTGLSFANYAGVGIVDYNLAGALILGTVPGLGPRSMNTLQSFWERCWLSALF